MNSIEGIHSTKQKRTRIFYMNIDILMYTTSYVLLVKILHGIEERRMR